MTSGTLDRQEAITGRPQAMQHVGQAVGKVRRQENRELLRQEDERLKGTKYIWLYREENLPDKHRPTLEALKATNLKVAKAWAMRGLQYS